MVDSVSIRPQLPSYTAITPDTKAPEKTEASAKTDLPTQSTVSPSSDSESSSRASDNPNDQQSRSQQTFTLPSIDRTNYVDPESESLIYQATDSSTGEVVQQIPSETMRRIRAYSKAQAEQAFNTALAQRFATTA